MAISLVGNAENAGYTSSLSVTLPTLAQNDVVYLFAALNDAGGLGAAFTTPTGYTELTAQDDGLGAKFHVYRKKMGASPDTTAVLVPTAGPVDIAAVAVCLRGVDQTTQEDATLTGTGWDSSTNQPDSPSITTVTNGAWVISGIGARVNDASVTAPSGYSNQVDITTAIVGGITVAAATILKATAGAENPPAWSNWLSFSNWYAVSVAVRPGITNQTLTATKFDNAQTFFTHVITKTRTLTATKFDNSNTFFTTQISVGPRTLSATKFDSAQTFFTHVVTRGSVTLAATLFANAQSFNTHTLSAIYNLSATLFANGQSFFTHAISLGAATLSPALFENAQAYHTQTITLGSVTLAPSLFVNDQFFDAFVVTLGEEPQNLLPQKFDNAQQFYPASIAVGAVTLTATLFEGEATFYAHTLALGLVATTFEDADSFYTHAISQESNLAPALFENASVFDQHVLTLTIEAALFEDDDTFYAATLDQFLSITFDLFQNDAEFFDITIESGSITLDVATYKNDTTFYAHHLGSRQRFVAPRGGRSRFEVDETRHNDPRTSSRTWR